MVNLPKDIYFYLCDILIIFTDFYFLLLLSQYKISKLKTNICKKLLLIKTENIIRKLADEKNNTVFRKLPSQGHNIVTVLSIYLEKNIYPWEFPVHKHQIPKCVTQDRF